MPQALSSEQSAELARLWRRRQMLSPEEMGTMYRIVVGALKTCNPPELQVLGEGRQTLVAQFIYLKVLRLDADPDEADDAARREASGHGAPSSAFALCAYFRRYLIDCTRDSAFRHKLSIGHAITEGQLEAQAGSADNGDALGDSGLNAASVSAAARAFLATLPQPERILLRESFGHAVASYHYRAGRLGLVHKREGLPADYARTTLGQWITQTLGIAIEPGNMGAILQVFSILGAEAPRMTIDLWPPLDLIRSALSRDDSVIDGAVPMARAAVAAPPREPDEALLLLPLTELARRREAVARRGFSARWMSGRLVSVLHEGRMLGVLLDKCLHDSLWRGWMAASEADWASAFDVLLEPDDEPFEPMFGLIQTWNVVTLEQSPQLCARVLGEISATRLAAVRAVHDEWAVQQPLATEPEPGRIALRTAGGAFSVLSGTPLGVGDPRADYQGLYLEAAARLTARLQTTPAPGQFPAAAPAAEGWWSRTRRWFAADVVARPAMALLALVVVVQNVGLLRGPSGEADDVQIRSVSTAPAAVVPADVSLRWRAGVRLDDAQELLRQAGAEVVSGPDADGHWRLRLADAAEGRSTLAASPLVESMGPP